PEGESPRHDREDRAERIDADVAPRRIRLARLLLQEARGVLGVVLRRPGTLLALRRALGDRLPHLERHRPRIVALLRPQKPRGLAQEGAALGERAAAPVEERDLCPGEDPLQLARRRLLEAFEHFARGRADGPEAHRPSPPAGERTLLCGPLHPTGSVARACSVIAPP